MVEDGKSGLLFRPGDTGSLVKAIRALQDHRLSARMGRRARALYEERYTEGRNLEHLMGIYAQAIEGTRDLVGRRDGSPREVG